MDEYIRKLASDLPSQFAGRERIRILLEAVGKQLSEVAAFYDGLNTMRTLQAAAGKLLDMIGSIVGLTRKEAAAMISADTGYDLDDEQYRTLLTYKMFLNTGRSTYKDIMRAIRLVYDAPNIKYSENPASSAAFTLTIPLEYVKSLALINVFPVKAAGVGVNFVLEADYGVNANIAMAVREIRKLAPTEYADTGLGNIVAYSDEHGNALTDEGGSVLY